jgi:hypothetical protein
VLIVRFTTTRTGSDAGTHPADAATPAASMIHTERIFIE